jgi:hypothetical protein
LHEFLNVFVLILQNGRRPAPNPGYSNLFAGTQRALAAKKPGLSGQGLKAAKSRTLSPVRKPPMRRQTGKENPGF